MNCWEFKKCGREKNGTKEKELGTCPAYTMEAGEACWLIAGTFCDGKKQGTFAEKINSCLECDFYKKFDLNHRSKMREKFNPK